MIKTSLPSAVIYGTGYSEFEIIESDIYFEEYLQEGIQIYRRDLIDERGVRKDVATLNADLIITIGPEVTQTFKSLFHSDDTLINNLHYSYPQEPPTNILANDIACQSTFRACGINDNVFYNKELPYFSAFTGAYKTEERLYRAYEGLLNQTYPNWEWVIVDDSPVDHGKTWQIANQIAAADNRVKVYKMFPISGGNVGEVKHRAASLANGNWLLELDHDDKVISTLFEDCVKAIGKHPDSGFIYTDVCELYENGEMRTYGLTLPNREWYGHPDNWFNWAYSGHDWVEADGERYLTHYYPEINPKTIRFNIGMPNHARLWRKDVYVKVGGHNRQVSVADDYELIVKTFLETKFTHIRKMLYLQFNNRNSTVDNNATDINRRARLIKDYYDPKIHARIAELGKVDTCWVEELGMAGRLQNDRTGVVYGEEEQILNYIIDEE